MSKPETVISKPTATEPRPIGRVYFIEPLDLPGAQESNVRCVAVPTATGRSYTATHDEAVGAICLKVYASGGLAGEHMVPLTYVKQFVWL